ncbi:MAG: DegT/DnrJ/EryC1/StrS family aminotransferase [Christensenellaceae bacterium]|jgi:dTDP-4-amino-4,6-dideoxygalactose transaminase|nr:DegT/DnrJ/EryC1/StrS family aminotransferase [Christensenellaceae bacterium]
MSINISVPFSPPDISEHEINAVTKVLRSGWITTGNTTKTLETRLAGYCGVNHCACMNSATACLELTLRLFGIGPGDEVIVPAYTYSASASVVAHVGAKIVLCDCAPHSYEMNYDALLTAITKRTKAIIAVDIAGKICAYDRIMQIVSEKKQQFSPNCDFQSTFGRILVIADAAHSFGATCDGRISGSIADFTSFSFHAVKNLTTAEGGAVVWRSIPGISDTQIYSKFMLMSLHGQSRDALSKTKPGVWEYDIVDTYYKCNMTDIAASIGLAQLDRYPKLLSRRKEITSLYDAGFSGSKITTLKHLTHNYQSSCHLYLTRIESISEKKRNEIIIELAKYRISSNVHYKPLPMFTAYKNLGFKIEDFPNAFNMYKSEISIPLHTLLTLEQIEHVISCYLKIAGDNT